MIRVMVIYDIPNDKRRKQASEACFDYGLERQQYSVFTGLVKPIHLRELKKILKPFAEDGHILVIPIASDEWDKRIELGKQIA